MEARGSASRLRLLALTCGFVVFLAAVTSVGLVIWREPSSSTSSGRASPVSDARRLAPSLQSGAGGPAGQLDESTGLAAIGPAKLTLPGRPYELDDDPFQIKGVFDAIFVADADVHLRYDGKHNWSATVGLAHVDPSLTRSSGLTGSSDLPEQCSVVLRGLLRVMFGGHRTSIAGRTSWDRSVDGHPGLLVRWQVHYAISQLPSDQDTVSAHFVRLDDGSLVVAVSSVPNDASAELKRLANTSTESLSIS